MPQLSFLVRCDVITYNVLWFVDGEFQADFTLLSYTILQSQGLTFLAFVQDVVDLHSKALVINAGTQRGV